MAEEKTKKKKKKLFGKEKEQKKDSLKEFRIALSSLDDKKKYYRNILIPLVIVGVLVFFLPVILGLLSPVPLSYNPITFVFGGIIPILLGIFYPYISWKNKESDINGKMHFFITHLRVLAISDLSLKDIINVLGGNKAYGSLGEELRKISVLSDQWRVPMAKSFRFVSERTPSKLLKDFLDRFSQSLDSGVEHREFIEHEQDSVLQEYKTMYEASNENILILSEVYVSMLIAIVFVMSLGIVMPMIMGSADMTSFLYLSSFMLIIAEVLLLYLLRSMVPEDEMWHRTKKKGAMEKNFDKLFKLSIIECLVIAIMFVIIKYMVALPVFQ